MVETRIRRALVSEDWSLRMEVLWRRLPQICMEVGLNKAGGQGESSAVIWKDRN